LPEKEEEEVSNYDASEKLMMSDLTSDYITSAARSSRQDLYDE